MKLVIAADIHGNHDSPDDGDELGPPAQRRNRDWWKN
jgi:hypothetical protein